MPEQVIDSFIGQGYGRPVQDYAQENDYTCPTGEQGRQTLGIPQTCFACRSYSVGRAKSLIVTLSSIELVFSFSNKLTLSASFVTMDLTCSERCSGQPWSLLLLSYVMALHR